MGLNHQNPPGEALNRRSTVSSTCYLPNLITICRRERSVLTRRRPQVQVLQRPHDDNPSFPMRDWGFLLPCFDFLNWTEIDHNSQFYSCNRIFIKRFQYRLQLSEIINCKFAYRQKGELRVNWRDEETFIYSIVG